MKLFLIRLLVFLSPILTLLIIYFCNDPFKVLYHYDSYFKTDGIQYIVLDKDFVSTETFKNNYPKYKYNSFILGNSRSIYYPVESWSKHINSNLCFHFDASGESVYGVERKLNFLAHAGVAIKNVLLVCDAGLFSIVSNEVGRTKMKSPDITGQSKFDFEVDFLKDFFDPEFLRAYISFLLHSKNNGEKFDTKVFDNVYRHYDPATNELTLKEIEGEIDGNRDSFYNAIAREFYERDPVQKYSGPVIHEAQKKLLENIKKVFISNKTYYKIVISPLYDQKKIDSTDLTYLQNLFGNENVFDFSGISDLTKSKYNYYEESHYRPFIANRIMNIIYSPFAEDSMRNIFSNIQRQ